MMDRVRSFHVFIASQEGSNSVTNYFLAEFCTIHLKIKKKFKLFLIKSVFLLQYMFCQTFLTGNPPLPPSHDKLAQTFGPKLSGQLCPFKPNNALLQLGQCRKGCINGGR